MKKKMYMILGLCLMFSMAGCGGEEKQEPQTNEPKEEAVEEEKEETPEKEEQEAAKEEEPEEEKEPEMEYETLTVDNANDVTVTMDYPKGMTFEELGYVDFLGQKVLKTCGVLKGEDLEITLLFAELISDAYADFEEYCGQFKSLSDIYEETEISGTKAWIRQAADLPITVILPHAERNFVGIKFAIPGATDPAPYKELKETENFKHMIESIKVSTGTVEAEAISHNDFFTVTPNSGWYKMEEDGRLRLKNDEVGTYSVMDFYTNVQESLIDMNNAITTIKGMWDVTTEPEVMTIGSNEFTVIRAEEDRTILLTENADQAILEIEVTGCVLEEALPVIETVTLN